MDRIHGDRLRGHLETLALSVLDRGDAHGFEILRRLKAAGNGYLEMKEGTLYPALYRLEEAGHIEGRWEENPGGRKGPRRRVYHVTRRGKRELVRKRDEWRRFVAVLGPIMEATS